MRDWKDSDLKTLFREMRARDHASAHRFEQDWEAARSKMRSAPKALFRYAIAAASAVAIVLSAVVVVRLVWTPSPEVQQNASRQDSGPRVQDLPDRHPSGLTADPPAAPKPIVRGMGYRDRAIKRVHAEREARRQNRKTAIYDDHQLISTWRSPTEFLLKSAATDLLRTVPSIQDSVVRIDGR